MDHCHICGMPIAPGQDTEECTYCGRVGHEGCGEYAHDSSGAEYWVCGVCWDDAAAEGEDLEVAPDAI